MRKARLLEGVYLLDTKADRFWMIHNNCTERMACAGAVSFKFLPYQLSTVGYWPTVALTGNGELGFDSGEGA